MTSGLIEFNRETQSIWKGGVGAFLGNRNVVITVLEKLFLNKRAFSNFFEKSKEFFLD